MPVPRISVVVPFYNNEDLLGDCLASIAAQTVTDLQVVMVDDGSTDGSAAIAAAQAAADTRFSLIRVPNGGPGAARNRGVAAASGEFLAFVDSDDLLPPNAYATLLAVLEQSGSDFVSGAVRRLTADGLADSGLHGRAIKTRRLGTQISRTPELFYDISVWNKLFRRSFWDAAGLAFPQGMLWEDLVAMTMAHVLARAVDVITEPVYCWRDRDKGAPSITQSRTDTSNLRDRITALEMIDDFLRERGTPAMLGQHQHKALVNDLWLYIGDLSKTSADYRSEFVGLARRYLGQVSPKVVAALPATRKLAYYLIAQDRQADLSDFAQWLTGWPARTPPMVRRFGRLRADLPVRSEPGLAIPARVLRPQRRELDPVVRVEGISWLDDRLVITGYAYLPSVEIGARRHATKLIVLLPRGHVRPPVVLRARSVRQPEVTARSGQDRYCYDWAGFRCEISPRWFRPAGHWMTGDWDCFVLVRARGTWRPARLHSPGPGAASPQSRRVGNGLTFGAWWAGGRLQLRIRPGRRSLAQPPAAVPSAAVLSSPAELEPLPPAQIPILTEQAWSKDGRLILRGQFPAAATGGIELELRRQGGGGRHAVAVDKDGDQFSVAIGVSALDIFGDRLPLRDGRWDILLRSPPEPVGGSASAGGAAGSDGAASAGGAASSAGVPGRDLASQAGIVTAPAIIGPKVYRCLLSAGAGGGLVLSVGPVLRWAERGRIRRRLLREIYYPIQRKLPLRAAIVFVSFHGKQCGDNPRAIADELSRRGDAGKHIWAVADWSAAVPPGATAVLIGTLAYFAAIGRSSCVISNDHMQRPFRKRSGQRYVQTWHGTPLKHIGYDIAAPKSASGTGYFDFLASDAAQWDLLLSPNPYSTPIMRRAFRYDGEIAETGYPRNDALLAGRGSEGTSGESAGPADRAAHVRELLGLPAGKRVAMYVPTWRDDQHDGSGAYRLDFQLDLEAAASRLAGDYVLLIRGHHLMASGLPAAVPPGFALDVTGYPDIADLLLVTDVLITDYSSVMFDFAPTGRPILFFTYDLERYRDQLRGFYFDFEECAPGPLLTSTAEVVAALADLDPIVARYSPARAAFTARFCPLDDGKASARACDRIFCG